MPPSRPEWISDSALLARAYELAESAHGEECRASDGTTFLEHVAEVGSLLREAGFDEQLVAVGLLHDAVERGTLTEPELRDAVGDEIADVVMTLSEDAGIEDFAERKRALREQVAEAGGRALTVFAADKLSDILGLRRGLEASGEGLAERMGTSVANMAGHYSESVSLIEAGGSGSVFLPVLRAELEVLGEEVSPAAEGAAPRRDTAGREWQRLQRARLTG